MPPTICNLTLQLRSVRSSVTVSVTLQHVLFYNRRIMGFGINCPFTVFFSTPWLEHAIRSFRHALLVNRHWRSLQTTSFIIALFIRALCTQTKHKTSLTYVGLKICIRKLHLPETLTLQAAKSGKSNQEYAELKMYET